MLFSNVHRTQGAGGALALKATAVAQHEATSGCPKYATWVPLPAVPLSHDDASQPGGGGGGPGGGSVEGVCTIANSKAPTSVMLRAKTMPPKRHPLPAKSL